MGGTAAAKLAWKKRNPKAEKTWTQTASGRLSRVYTNMQCRCKTLMQGSPRHYGLPIISRQQFIEWAESTNEYGLLFAAWALAGFARELVPTVDRKNPKEGYILNNMEWVTQSENSRRNVRQLWDTKRYKRCLA